jgi:class 3 adenylate cyclase/predicted alpha/beta hydrolase
VSAIPPETRYVSAADGTRIAYQIHGQGRRDLLFLPGHVSHLDLHWEDPNFAEIMAALGSFARVIAVDRRGVGLSDRLSPDDLPPVEVLVSDVALVLDEVRSFDTVLIGLDEGAQIGVLFAASHPERLSGLILYGMSPSGVPRPDMPWVPPASEMEAWLDWSVARYGSREQAMVDMQETSPSRSGDERYLTWLSAMYRYGASPSAYVALYRMSMQLDVTEVLPAVRTPTLVMHRSGDHVVPFTAAEYIAQRLPNARLVELDGEDHFPNSTDTRQVIDTIRDFVGAPRGQADVSRRLATLLFTDIVDSTRQAVELGDHAWSHLLEQHHGMVREELQRHAGHEVSTTGDGFFATFDGPARAVQCACAIASGLDALGLEVRAGVHTGEVATIDGEVGGLAVHIAARIGALAGPAEVLVSSTVKDLVAGSGLTFEDRGEHVLKGVPDPWHLYRALT